MWTLLTVLLLISSGCSGPPVRHEDTADHVCRPNDTNCIPVTPGFIEERIENLVEIDRLRKEIATCHGKLGVRYWTPQPANYDYYIEKGYYPGAVATEGVSFAQSTFKCTVHGTLYVNEGAGHLTGREDGCQMLDVAMTDEGIRVQHKSIRVYIPVPMTGGHMQFHYRWGSDVATIGGQERPVHVEYD